MEQYQQQHWNQDVLNATNTSPLQHSMNDMIMNFFQCDIMTSRPIHKTGDDESSFLLFHDLTAQI